MARARGDLAIARAPLPEDAFLEDLCFHAQQAAEKAMKAVLLHLQRQFPYTHDLDTLADVIRSAGLDVPVEIDNATELSGYAWESRYPGLYEPISEVEHAQALELAERVVVWAQTIIGHTPEG